MRRRALALGGAAAAIGVVGAIASYSLASGPHERLLKQGVELSARAEACRSTPEDNNRSFGFPALIRLRSEEMIRVNLRREKGYHGEALRNAVEARMDEFRASAAAAYDAVKWSAPNNAIYTHLRCSGMIDDVEAWLRATEAAF